MKKKILTQNFKILTPPPNRPNSKFWNSDFARWWHLSRRFISEKIGASSWKLIEWQAKNLQKWPNFTQFWLWTPIKNFRDKNSKFHFQHFLPNIGLKKYAKFQRATIKTLGGDSVSQILTPARPPARPDGHRSVPDRISSADYVTAELTICLFPIKCHVSMYVNY